MTTPDFIFLGPPKSGSTWIYECLKSHPEVSMPRTDSLNYFDMNYFRGEKWYSSKLNAEDEKRIGETSKNYLYDTHAASRISRDLEDSKLIVTLRNPVQRAFSHYWHNKQREGFERNFESCLQSYNDYQNWVVPGFYHHHISRFLEYFDEENIKIMFFDDLVEDDLEFIQEIYDFIGVDSDFEPEQAGETVNEAKRDWNLPFKIAKDSAKLILPDGAKKTVRPVYTDLKEKFTNKSEYDKGVPESIRKELEKVYKEDVRKLEEHTGRDLSHWFEYEKLEG